MADDRLKLQELLNETGINLHQLKTLTGISYQTLLRYRDGENLRTSNKHVRLICEALKRDPNALYGIGKPGKVK